VEQNSGETLRVKKCRFIKTIQFVDFWY
jgi:hypothetical protein